MREYPPIEDHGIIGNLYTVALVTKQGSIDFFCYPNYDSPTLFGALLDKDKGGSFDLSPKADSIKYKQLYLPDTNVLLSRFYTRDGIAELTDYMPMQEELQIIRSVKMVRGCMNFELCCQPAFNYARTEHALTAEDEHHAVFTCDEQISHVQLWSDQSLQAEEVVVRSTFTLDEGETATFILHLPRKNQKSEPPANIDNYVHGCFRATVAYWKNWSRGSTYTGKFRRTMLRSALVLKLLTSQKYGAPVAAATFGLPEHIGAERNWDYRYTWIRDAAFSMYAFIRMGFLEEAGAFLDWIWARLEDAHGKAQNLQLMYCVNGESDLAESELDQFEGYKQSRPVRIGNGAAEQLQLDIFGELMDSIYLYDKNARPITYDAWLKITRLIDYVCDHWQEKDHGIWEMRGEKQAFLYSRLMCWGAVDRAVRLAEKRSFPYDFNKWRGVRKSIHHDIYDNFWNEERQAYVMHKETTAMDGSTLLMPLVRFISPYDPRWQSTLKAIEEDLVVDTMVFRYRQDDVDDGFDSPEGTFSVCSFWYVENLVRMGEVERAELFFEKMLGYGNHLGLFAEEIGLQGEQLGNFPQAFTHLGLISAGFALNRALRKGGGRPDMRVER